MELFKKTPQIDFLGIRYIIIGISITLFIGAIAMIRLYGLHWGLDFTGGLQLQLELKQPTPLSTIRQQLIKSQLPQVHVQSYGTSNTLLLTLPATPAMSEAVFTQRVLESIPQAIVHQMTFVGPQAGQELLMKALWALCVALLGILTYAAIRFEYRLALGAIIALIHDPIVILGVFSWKQCEISLTTLAAILTVIGYSLNNIIVIFDRIRENFNRLTNKTPVQIVNQSINETLARTLITSGITLMMVLILYAFGGPLLHSFALALAIGILVGGYSSIYVASSLAIALGLLPHHMHPSTPAIDDRP